MEDQPARTSSKDCRSVGGRVVRQGGDGAGRDGEAGALQFRVYKQRWFVLLTVALLNISNAALWITYAPVSTVVAQYYDKYDGEVNYFSVVYLLATIPFCFVATAFVNRAGLRYAIHVGSALNCLGAIVKAVGTSPLVGGSEAQLAVSLTGQVIAATAQSFLLFIATKVSQVWFPVNQRTIATTLISLSNPLGIVVGSVVTPLVVLKPDDVPLNNYVWMGFAIFSQLCAFAFITRAKPPTPASFSSTESEVNRESYLRQLKSCLTCRPYLLLLLMLGFGIGFLSAIATVTQQMLCGLGYGTGFCGIAPGLLIIAGFVGSAIFSIYVDKTKRFTPVCKLCYGCSAIAGIFMLEFYLQPHQGAALLVFCSLFGFFGVGGYPIGLELAVEATYPVEESISTGFIFLSGQLQGMVMIAVVGLMATEQRPEHAALQVCSEDNGEIVPKDYSNPVMVLMSMMTLFVGLLILFMHTPYKRLEAEKEAKPRVEMSYF